MMDMHPISVSNLRISVTVITTVAQLATGARVAYRTKTSGLWFDDCMAALSALFALAGLICFWIKTDVSGVGPMEQPHNIRLYASWVLNIMWICSTWSTRLSILFSSMRIGRTHSSPIRHRGIGIAGLFGAMWVVLLVENLYICNGNKNAWMSAEDPVCTDRIISITTAALHLASALCLVSAPFWMPWNMHPGSFQRFLLLVLFIVGIAVAGFSAARVAFDFMECHNLQLLFAILEGPGCLLLANLAVFTIFIYRTLHWTENASEETGAGQEKFTPTRHMRRQATLKDKIGMPGKMTIPPLTYNVATLKGMQMFQEKDVATETPPKNTGSWVSVLPGGEKRTSQSPATSEVIMDYSKADSIRLSGNKDRDGDQSSVSLYSIEGEETAAPTNRPQSPALQRLSSAIRDRAVRFLSGHQTLGKRDSHASSQFSTYSRESWRRSAVVRSAERYTPSPLAGEPHAL